MFLRVRFALVAGVIAAGLAGCADDGKTNNNQPRLSDPADPNLQGVEPAPVSGQPGPGKGAGGKPAPGIE